MASGDTGEKTEAATPQKLKELRKKNTARRSQDLPSAMSLLVLALMLPMLVGNLYTALLSMMKQLFTASATVDDSQGLEVLGSAVVSSYKPIIFPLLLIMGAVAVTHMGYTRQKPNPAALKPQWKTLSPKEGFKRIFSVNSLVELGKGLAKIGAVGTVAFFAWQSGVTELLSGVASVEGFAASMGSSIKTLVTQVAIVALFIGAIDAWWQNKRFNKQAKMSKYDVKREHKQSDGDPLIKAQIRQRGQALTRNAMVAAAGDSDVVVVNPTHIAVALKYEDGMPAPKVVAKGAGHVATRIREIAEDNGVPIKREVPLARALHKNVDVGQWIPIELYSAAATLLAEVFKDRRKQEGAR